MNHHREGFRALVCGVLATIVALASIAMPAQAVPAAPGDFDLTQPDGTTFTARLWGDEWLHGYETVEGYTITEDERSGFWVYAQRDATGELRPALANGRVLIVGKDRPQGLNRSIRPDLPADSPRLELERQRMESMNQAQGTEDAGPRLGKNLGVQRLAVIYVRFANRGYSVSPSYFYNLAFGPTGSIRSFYLRNSFGNLDLQPAQESQGNANDGFIELALPINHPDDTDASRSLATSILQGSDSYINFALYDTDGDGTVSATELHLLFIVAGYEESFGSGSPSIWAHQWNLNNNLTLDGKRVATNSPDGDYGGYFMFGEIHGDHAATVGVMIHELGHDLSMPDLYDTDQYGSGGYSEGVGSWSVMGGGSWNRTSLAGDSPAELDAFLKYYQGWINPRTVSNGVVVGLRRADQYPDALFLGTNPLGVDWDFTRRSGTGEYFLVENRQEAGLPGCGILIWHIDESRTYTNGANANPNRSLVDLIQADGFRDLNFGWNRGDAGDPFPGYWNNMSFNNSSDPASIYYDSSPSNRGITINTASCGTTMNLLYQGPVISYNNKLFIPDLLR